MSHNKATFINYNRVRELFNYNEATGGLVRKVTSQGTGASRPMTPRTRYKSHRVDGKMYKEHRLTYMYHNEDMDQSLEIDHINEVKTDNRIENLRLVLSQENNFNRSYALGFITTPHNSYRAYIRHNKRQIALGTYDNILDARAAYLRAKKKYHIIEER